MQNIAQALKALSDETRLRIVTLLRHGELCVCDLMAVLDMPQSTVSRHLATLRNAGWVRGRRGGKWMYYSLSQDLSPETKALRASVLAALIILPEMQDDAEKLQAFLAEKKADTCSAA